MIFPGSPGQLSFFQDLQGKWEPCEPVSIEPGTSAIWSDGLWAIQACATWEIWKIFMWSCSNGST